MLDRRQRRLPAGEPAHPGSSFPHPGILLRDRLDARFELGHHLVEVLARQTADPTLDDRYLRQVRRPVAGAEDADAERYRIGQIVVERMARRPLAVLAKLL